MSALCFEERPSPNHSDRCGSSLDLVVLHYTGMESESAAIDVLAAPESGVSCHYVLRSDGGIVRMVDESRRAWHAGVSSWHGETDINSRSIGIEISNGGHEFGCPPYPAGQIASLIALLRDILDRHAIVPRGVVAHSDIAPERKRDPGEWFPWHDLARAGVCLAVPALPGSTRGAPCARRGDSGPATRALQNLVIAAGFSLAVDGEFGAATESAVRAFQRRHRPTGVGGVADAWTVAALFGWSVMYHHGSGSRGQKAPRIGPDDAAGLTGHVASGVIGARSRKANDDPSCREGA